MVLMFLLGRMWNSTVLISDYCLFSYFYKIWLQTLVMSPNFRTNYSSTIPDEKSSICAPLYNCFVPLNMQNTAFSQTLEDKLWQWVVKHVTLKTGIVILKSYGNCYQNLDNSSCRMTNAVKTSQMKTESPVCPAKICPVCSVFNVCLKIYLEGLGL